MSKRLDDIIKNTSETFKNNTMQIAVFKINDNNFYGINVNKIKGLERTQVASMARTQGDTVNTGIRIIRDETYPVINLDKWLNNDVLDEYKYLILSEFNQVKVSFLATNILRIFNKNSEELEKSTLLEGKVTYITRIEIENKEELCLVLDVENLIDTLSANSTRLEEIKDIKKQIYKKEVVFAEDSRVAQKHITATCQAAGIKYSLFEDGEGIINYLNNHSNPENVGVIISDIEMPKVDGFKVAQYVRNEKQYKDKPFYFYSSMSNEGVANKAKQLKVEFLEKTEPKKLVTIFNQFCK